MTASQGCTLGLAFMLVLCASPARGDFLISEFTSPDDLNLVGTAMVGEGTLGITSLEEYVRGACWHSAKQRVACGFFTEFQFELASVGGEQTADGFAFVIQNDRPDALGGVGSALGYGRYEDSASAYGHLVEPGIRRSLAVEFDTWYNRERQDPSTNHISVHSCGSDENRSDGDCLIIEAEAQALLVSPLPDSGQHTARISYEARQLDVALDGELLVSVRDLDIADLLALEDGTAWVGFTAATGLFIEVNEIQSWWFIEQPCPSGSSGDSFRRGDVDLDGAWSIGDGIRVIHYVFGLSGELACRDAADTNDDGRLNLADALYLFTWLFRGDVSMPDPHPGCGTDPTGDSLDCDAYAPCR